MRWSTDGKSDVRRYFWVDFLMISYYSIILFVLVMVLNATFNNISVISWRSVLLVGETRVPWENHWPAASHWQSLSHNVASSTLCCEQDSSLENWHILYELIYVTLLMLFGLLVAKDYLAFYSVERHRWCNG
jgi:hypothetical protein